MGCPTESNALEKLIAARIKIVSKQKLAKKLLSERWYPKKIGFMFPALHITQSYANLYFKNSWLACGSSAAGKLARLQKRLHSTDSITDTYKHLTTRHTNKLLDIQTSNLVRLITLWGKSHKRVVTSWWLHNLRQFFLIYIFWLRKAVFCFKRKQTSNLQTILLWD